MLRLRKLLFILSIPVLSLAQQTCPTGTLPITTTGVTVINNVTSYGLCINYATGAILVSGQGVYNVKSFGLVADGVTDNTAALNALLNTITSNGGGTIYFPASPLSYVVKSCITIPVNAAYQQVPLRITGDSSQRTNINSATQVQQGSILDIQCNNGTHADGIGVILSNVTSASGNAVLTTASTTCSSSANCSPIVNGDSISCAAVIAGTATVISPVGATVASFVPNTSITMSTPALASSGVVGCNIGGNVGGKLNSFGWGSLEIDHLSFAETQSTVNATPFIYSTFTVPNYHDNAFFGHPSLTTFQCTEDAIVLGGSVNIITGVPTGINLPAGTNGTAADPFQGYKPTVERNGFYNIRRSLLGRTYLNGLYYANNFVDWRSGNNQTIALTAATNTNPVVLTLTGLGVAIGNTFRTNISGGTGSWTAINGQFTATAVTANTFSIPVNSTAFGALTGSMSVPWGGVVEIRGGTPVQASNFAVGGYLAGNYIEGRGSAFSYLLEGATSHIVIAGYDSVDGGWGNISGIRLQGSSTGNVYQPSFINGNWSTLFSDASYTGSQLNNTAISPPFTGNSQSWITSQQTFAGSPGLTLANNAPLSAITSAGVTQPIITLDSGNNLNISALNVNQMQVIVSSGHQLRIQNHTQASAVLAVDDSTNNVFFGSNSAPTITAGLNGFGNVPIAIASLPACNSTSPVSSSTGTSGMQRVVNNATAPTFLGTLTAGGAVVTPVVCNGTAWVSY